MRWTETENKLEVVILNCNSWPFVVIAESHFMFPQ